MDCRGFSVLTLVHYCTKEMKRVVAGAGLLYTPAGGGGGIMTGPVLARAGCFGHCWRRRARRGVDADVPCPAWSHRCCSSHPSSPTPGPRPRRAARPRIRYGSRRYSPKRAVES